MPVSTLRARRPVLHLLLGLSIAAASGVYAPTVWAAEDYPSRPIRLVVPYAAGGGPDIQTRKLGEVLGKELGQPVVIENKVGAGGMLAAEYVSQQRADGYTLLLGSSTHIAQKLLQPSARFDPAAFTHISRIGSSPAVLVVRADSPYRAIDDLVDAARRAPGTLNYASGGIGSAAHIAGAAFISAVGVDALHIPYKGSVDIVPALIKGDTQFAFPVASTAVPQINNGKVRPLAVTSSARNAMLPQTPTLNEALGRTDMRAGRLERHLGPCPFAQALGHASAYGHSQGADGARAAPLLRRVGISGRPFADARRLLPPDHRGNRKNAAGDRQEPHLAQLGVCAAEGR